jgi:hypothetical protein
LPCFGISAWPEIVGESRPWADEDLVCQRDAAINGDVVLDLAPIADPDVCVDVRTFADDAVLANQGSRTYVSVVPDPGAGPDYAAVVDHRGRVGDVQLSGSLGVAINSRFVRAHDIGRRLRINVSRCVAQQKFPVPKLTEIVTPWTCSDCPPIGRLQVDRPDNANESESMAD